MSDARDVPGNARESALQVQRFLMKQSETLVSMERIADRYYEAEMNLTSIRIRFPRSEGDGYLGVVSAEGPAGKVVAFHDATEFLETLVGLIRRLDNGSVKWKEDKYE